MEATQEPVHLRATQVANAVLGEGLRGKTRIRTHRVKQGEPHVKQGHSSRLAAGP